MFRYVSEASDPCYPHFTKHISNERGSGVSGRGQPARTPPFRAVTICQGLAKLLVEKPVVGRRDFRG